MRQFRTTRCHSLGLPEISFALDERLGESSAWLVPYFEQAVAAGERFRAGETVQFGASILMITLNETGDLELCEPKPGVVPFSWRKGITEATRHLILQRSVAEALHVDPAFPSYAGPALIDDASLRPRTPITMQRRENPGTAVEWSFFRKKRRATDRLRSLFEVVSLRSDVIPFLALPVPASVALEPGRLTIECGGRIASSETSRHLRSILASLTVTADA